jgi:transcriptional regulator with XRE-family HTH domain/Zn-dependent peptidase ImmA (M78 family)
MHSTSRSVEPDVKPSAGTVGKIIRSLRRQRHLTQTELGRRIGMRPGPMNNIEQGRSLPSTPVLCRIATVLDVTVDTLLGRPLPYVRESTPPVTAVRETPASYTTVQSEERARYRVPLPRPDFSGASGLPSASPVRLLPTAAPYAPAMLEKLEDLVHAYLTLEDLCGATRRAAIPLCLSMPRTEVGIEDFAMRVRALLGIGPGVIFDYLELFENAGLRVIFAPLPGNVESAACHDPASENAFLFVSTAGHATAERQLFRLVCELGRIYCHTGCVRQVAGRVKSLDAEHVASKFTAFFLMPAEAVHATVRQVGVNYDGWTWEMLLRLKHRFGVSAETFLYRLGELDLIAPKQLADLKSRIQAHYAATHHAEPDGSRRILSPNGRLGDLLLMAGARTRNDPDLAREYAAVRRHLKSQI